MKFAITILTTIVALSCILDVGAQINSYNTPVSREITEPYDSLESVNPLNIKNLKGQSIYFPENSYTKGIGGYRDRFYTTYTNPASIYSRDKKVYCPIKGKNNITDYNAITNHTFKIVSIDGNQSNGCYCFCLEDSSEPNKNKLVLNEDGIFEPSNSQYQRIYMTYIVQNYDNPRFIIEGNVKKLEGQWHSSVAGGYPNSLLKRYMKNGRSDTPCS